MTGFHRLARGLVGSLLIGSVLIGCGIPQESEPRAVAPERIPAELSGVTTPPVTNEPTGVRYPVYMLTTAADGDSAVLVEHPVIFDGPDTPSPSSMVSRLFQTVPVELDPGVFNRIPPELGLAGGSTGFVVDGDLARITLNDAIENVQAESFFQAVAQIVFTATEVGGIERVQLLDEEGDPIEIPLGDGSDDVVTRADFSALDPE